MRIILASTFVPFVNGGARFIVEWLEQKLLEHGHEVERFYLPFEDGPNRLLDQTLAFRLMDLSARGDRLITFRPPSHSLRHPNKVVWFIHHIRGYYDLAGTPYQSFASTPKGYALRDALHRHDTTALKEARHVFTNSAIVGDRLKRFNDIPSEVLYPPLLEPERFRNEGYGDEVVCVCRIEQHKRQELLIEAMRHVKSPVRLRLCGRSFSPDYEKKLAARIKSLGLGERITLEASWITEDTKVERIAGALACAYLPVDEDSYGYPTLEAAAANKPVLTASDAGGVMEFVEDGVNGLVAEPSPQSVAACLDRFYQDKDATARMGTAARETVRALNIDWDHIVRKLLQ